MTNTQLMDGQAQRKPLEEADLPIFMQRICNRSRLQKKMLLSFLETQDAAYWKRLEEFTERILPFYESIGAPLDHVVTSYLKMCSEMIAEQIAFKKTGRYTSSSAAEANAKIYSSEQGMSSYMYGLALSQYLWANHYRMFDFFIRTMAKLQGLSSYLEVGPGHGLFLYEAIRINPKARFTAVDISPASIRLSQGLAKHFYPAADCTFVNSDVCDLQGTQYDCIVMCELLEHLDDPVSMLQKAKSLLHKEGSLFITTCANAPAIDHVYLYRDVEHIRTQLQDSGFRIRDEICLPVGNFPRERWSADRVEVNYAALLERGAP